MPGYKLVWNSFVWIGGGDEINLEPVSRLLKVFDSSVPPWDVPILRL